MKLITESDIMPENFTGIVEYTNGDKEWFRNGKLHREDGPAKEYADGYKFWYLNGRRITKTQFMVFKTFKAHNFIYGFLAGFMLASLIAALIVKITLP